MNKHSHFSTDLCDWLFRLSSNCKIYTPLNYSIIHDYAHAKNFSLPKRELPNVLLNRPEFGSEYPNNNAPFRDIRPNSNVLILVQQLNDNYIYPVLQFLNSKGFKRNYLHTSVQFEFLAVDSLAFKIKHQSAIESTICSAAQSTYGNISFKYTEFNQITSGWKPSSTYFDQVFETPTQIVPVIDTEEKDASRLSDIISTNLVIYESALNYLIEREISVVITANDQWYPTSGVFSAACDLSISTILTYHGTMPKFAEYTFADQIYYYSPSFYSTKASSERPRYVEFKLPLDLFIANSKEIDPINLLQNASGGARQGTLGIISALNGDLIYNITDYKKSLEDIINAVYDLKSAEDTSLHSIVLRSHPHENVSSRRIINNSLNKLTQIGLNCTIDNTENFLEFVSRCGPLAACPSTALDSLIHLGYPFLVSSTNELMNIVFGKQLYDDCDITICSNKGEILSALKRWF